MAPNDTTEDETPADTEPVTDTVQTAGEAVQSRRAFLRGAAVKVGKIVGKQIVYGTVGATLLESSNAGNWHKNEKEDKTTRRTIGAAMGLVAGNIIERKLSGDKIEKTDDQERGL